MVFENTYPYGIFHYLYENVDFYRGGALIAGNSNGELLRYDGQGDNLTMEYLFPDGNYTGVAFQPGETPYVLNYALIIGDKIVEWELGNFNIIVAGGYSGNDVTWFDFQFTKI